MPLHAGVARKLLSIPAQASQWIMRESCYDEVPEEPWAHRPRLSKTSLSADVIENRHTWAEWVKSLNHRPSWYYDHLVWTDLCNSILPRSMSKAKEQAQARKGSKGWMSEGTQTHGQVDCGRGGKFSEDT